jgi:uncharacterized protein YggE
MKRARPHLTFCFALAACASPGVQSPAGAATPLERVSPNIYEVAPEQVAAAQAPSPQQPFIEVVGTASVEVPADEAQVAFAMETRATDASDASAANAAAMARVFAALRAGGFQDLVLETFGYSLQPQYATDDTRVRSIVGYVAFNNVRATIGNVEDVGRLIDVAVAAGANRVASIAFAASDTEAARRQALAAAVANARAQAQAIAAALGYELGPPLEIHGGAQRPAPIPVAYEARPMMAQAAPTPIEAGAQTVDASVTIRFALGPEVARR